MINSEDLLKKLILPRTPSEDPAAFERAVAAQDAHCADENGVPAGVESYSVGAFSAKLTKKSAVAPEARAILAAAGLLYRGGIGS